MTPTFPQYNTHSKTISASITRYNINKVFAFNFISFLVHEMVDGLCVEVEGI